MVFLNQYLGFPGGLVVNNLPVNAGDMGSGRSPGGGKGNPLQYSCLENPVDRGAVTYSPWGHKRVSHNLATKQSN